jgi:polyhydroxyalkanoate synthesis regulator phasin
MLNLIEKPFYFGLGIFAYSKEKIEKAANDLVKAGKIDKGDVENFVDEMLERGKDQKEEVRKILKDEVEKVLTKMDIAKKSDVLDDEKLRTIIREELANISKESK